MAKHVQCEIKHKETAQIRVLIQNLSVQAFIFSFYSKCIEIIMWNPKADKVIFKKYRFFHGNIELFFERWRIVVEMPNVPV